MKLDSSTAFPAAMASPGQHASRYGPLPSLSRRGEETQGEVPGAAMWTARMWNAQDAIKSPPSSAMHKQDFHVLAAPRAVRGQEGKQSSQRTLLQGAAALNAPRTQNQDEWGTVSINTFWIKRFQYSLIWWQSTEADYTSKYPRPGLFQSYPCWGCEIKFLKVLTYLGKWVVNRITGFFLKLYETLQIM